MFGSRAQPLSAPAATPRRGAPVNDIEDRRQSARTAGRARGAAM